MNADLSNDAFEQMEKDIQKIIERGYKDITQDLTRSLNGIVQSTALNAEYVLKSVNISISQIKGRLLPRLEEKNNNVRDDNMVPPSLSVKKYIEEIMADKKEYINNIEMKTIKSRTDVKRNRPEVDERMKKLVSKPEKILRTKEIVVPNKIKKINMSPKFDKSYSLTVTDDDFKKTNTNSSSLNSLEEEGTRVGCKEVTKLSRVKKIIEDEPKSVEEETTQFEESVDETSYEIHDSKDGQEMLHLYNGAQDVDAELTCSKCSFKTTSETKLSIHFNMTHKEKEQEKYKCNDCDDIFLSKWDLLRHHEAVHQKINETKTKRRK